MSASSSRRSALPTTDPNAAPTLGDAGKVVAWGLAFWGAEQLAAAALGTTALALGAAQAAVAEWGTARMGIAWTDPRDPAARERRAIVRRALRGAGFGAAASALVIGAAAVAHGAVAQGTGLAIGPLGIGFLAAALVAVRDELLLRGVALRATRLLPWPIGLVVCGLVAAAARLGIDGRMSGALAPEALRGAALGALWLRDRGAWTAWGANTAWTWITGPVCDGGLVDVRFAGEPGTGVFGVAALAFAALAAAFYAARGRRARPPWEQAS